MNMQIVFSKKYAAKADGLREVHKPGYWPDIFQVA
jgi:hypothetical protein